jgi:hypothetical protein
MIQRWAVRILLVSCVIAIVIAAVDFGVRSVPTRASRVVRTHHRKPLAPRPGQMGEFAMQCLVMGLIAVAGRRVLRLRL